jgi:hypothetical protein
LWQCGWFGAGKTEELALEGDEGCQDCWAYSRISSCGNAARTESMGGISRAGRGREPASLARAAPESTQVGQRPSGASAGMTALQRGQRGTDVFMTGYLRKR